MEGVWVLHGEVVNYEEVRDYLCRDTDYFNDWLANYYSPSQLVEFFSKYERVDEAMQDLRDAWVEQRVECIVNEDIDWEICFIPFAKSYRK